MRDFFQSITKVTLAFVLIFILTGCGNVYGSTDPMATLPVIGPSISESTELGGIGVEDTMEQTKQTETTEETETIIDLTEIESTKDETTEVETTEVESTEEETTTVEETTEVSTETETTPVETTKSAEYTFTEMATYMYVKEAVNVRTLPCVDGEKVTVFGYNHEVWVTGRCNETGWYRINLEGQSFYMSDGYLSAEKLYSPDKSSSGKPTHKVYNTDGFVYYTVSGRYPDRSYEEYLYGCLVDRGIAWWYPYAVAQIWTESCWTPTSYNGVDAGICQFNEASFSRRAAHHANFPDANIWNPYDSLYVYSFYIRDILRGCNNNVEAAWSYYIKGHFNDPHPTYIASCWKWYNSLDAR